MLVRYFLSQSLHLDRQRRLLVYFCCFRFYESDGLLVVFKHFHRLWWNIFCVHLCTRIICPVLTTKWILCKWNNKQQQKLTKITAEHYSQYRFICGHRICLKQSNRIDDWSHTVTHRFAFCLVRSLYSSNVSSIFTPIHQCWACISHRLSNKLNIEREGERERIRLSDSFSMWIALRLWYIMC